MTASLTSALPKYLQISEMLIRDIAAGRLADGARLP
jgi:GntR family transcriptional regulator